MTRPAGKAMAGPLGKVSGPGPGSEASGRSSAEAEPPGRTPAAAEPPARSPAEAEPGGRGAAGAEPPARGPAEAEPREDVIGEPAFGRTEGFTVGLEEELLLVDPETRGLADAAERILPEMAVPPGAAGFEAYAAELELRSPPCRDVGEAAEALAAGRRAARAAGATLMGAGLHPTAGLGDARLVRQERYRRVDEEMRGLIRRTPECALHVHVGMPDAETAVRAFNGLRSRLPLLQGLSANSPWRFGVDSGLASARFALVRAYPGRGVPPAFRDFGEWAELVEQAAAAGGLCDYTLLWWDVRLHPRLGTVELREMDAQASLEDAAALAALVHALARHEADRAPAPPPPPPEAIAWSSFRAARDGLEATILHEGTFAPLELAARETVARVRAEARELGADAALEGIERILRRGGGAARQRAAHACGGTEAMLDLLIEETAG